MIHICWTDKTHKQTDTGACRQGTPRPPCAADSLDVSALHGGEGDGERAVRLQVDVQLGLLGQDEGRGPGRHPVPGPAAVRTRAIHAGDPELVGAVWSQARHQGLQLPGVDVHLLPAVLDLK